MSQTGTDRPKSKHAASWLVSVETGPHTGALFPIDLPLTRFGKSLDNDIVAADDCLTDREAEFVLEKNRLALRQLGSALAVDGRNVSAGETVRLRSGMTIRAGDTRLRVRRAARTTSNYLQIALFAGGLAVMALLLIFIIQSRILSRAALATAAPVAAPRLLDPAPTLLADLSKRMQARGFANSVHLRKQGSAILAVGALPANQVAAWHRLIVWFDRISQSRIMLIDQVRTAPAIAAPVAVAAVAFGHAPYLVSRSGKHYGLGAAVPGGWILHHVAAHHVILVRGAKTLRINF